MTVDTLIGLWNLGLAAVTTTGVLSALYFYRKQAEASTKEHLSNIHLAVFERLDAKEIRSARHYVYAMDQIVDAEGKWRERKPEEMDELAFRTESWLAQESGGAKSDGKGKAEIVARALDQLGYLVREGIVPVNVVARFYTFPTLRCWYQLCPYVYAIRDERDQLGHMWEWENLVERIINGARGGKGVWEGTSAHDNLERYASMIEERVKLIEEKRKRLGLQTRVAWNPPDRAEVS